MNSNQRHMRLLGLTKWFAALNLALMIPRTSTYPLDSVATVLQDADGAPEEDSSWVLDVQTPWVRRLLSEKLRCRLIDGQVMPLAPAEASDEATQVQFVRFVIAASLIVPSAERPSDSVFLSWYRSGMSVTEVAAARIGELEAKLETLHAEISSLRSAVSKRFIEGCPPDVEKARTLHILHDEIVDLTVQIYQRRARAGIGHDR